MGFERGRYGSEPMASRHPHSKKPVPCQTEFTFNDTTSMLSGIPAVGSADTYTITIIAIYGVDTDAMQTFTLTVSP
jgi:hypothetical protein